MKNSWMVASAALTIGGVAAAESIDLATYWAETPTEAQTLPEGDYTLSADYTLPVGLNMKQGSTFDFPAGKTFSPAGGVTLTNPFKDKTTRLKGGTWDFVGKSMLFDYSGTRVDNYSFVVDGATVTNVGSVFLIPSGVGGAASFALTNGAALKLNSSQYSELCRLRTTDDPFVFDISTGSTLESPAGVYFAYTAGGDPGCRQNCTLRVRDAGSKLTTENELVIGQYSPGYTLEVSDGGYVNAKNLHVGRGGQSHDNTVIVRGAGSTLHSIYPKIGEFDVSANNSNLTSNNWVYALDGATVTLSTDYQQDCPVGPYSAHNGIFVSNATLKASAVLLGQMSAAGSNNVLRLYGPDAQATFSYSWEGNKSRPYRPFGAGERCALLLEDGAKMSGAPTLGWDLCGTNCLVRVEGGGGCLNLSKDFCFSGRGNRVEVLNGARFAISKMSDVCDGRVGSGNELFVSNATFYCTSILLGQESEAASNNVFVAKGAGISMGGITNPYRPFGPGPNCALCIEDGTQQSFANSVDLCGTNCLFRVAGKDALYDVRNFDISGKGNTVEVLDGGLLKCYISHTYYSDANGVAHDEGTDNTIVVSNGTFTSYQYYGIFIKGESNKLVLKGNSPRVESTCGSHFYLYDGAKLVFELPIGETEYAQPPLSFNYMYVTDGTRGDVEGTGADPEILFPNLEEYRKSIDRTVNLQIGDCYTGARMKQIIKDTNAKLPKGCKLTAEQYGKKIVLQVKPDRGLLMIVR